MKAETIGAGLVLLAAVMGALGFLLKKAYLAFKMGERAFIELIGTKDEPSLREAQVALAAEVAAVKKELHPNGGSSFRDDVNAKIGKVQHDVTNVRAGQEVLLGQVEGATTASARAAQRAEDTARQVENVAEQTRVEVAERLTAMREEIAADAERRDAMAEQRAAERTAEAFDLLAEVTMNRPAGPIRLPRPDWVPPHAHELPQRTDPTLTGGPVEPEE